MKCLSAVVFVIIASHTNFAEACLTSQSLEQMNCAPVAQALRHQNDVSTSGWFQPYRWFSMADGDHRQCRLQPTCSLFLHQALQRQGVKGIVWGLARIQMEHSDQNDFLTSHIASDGLFIYLDPVEMWAHP